MKKSDKFAFKNAIDSRMNEYAAKSSEAHCGIYHSKPYSKMIATQNLGKKRKKKTAYSESITTATTTN